MLCPRPPVGGFEPLIETLEKRDPEDWDPDQEK